MQEPVPPIIPSSNPEQPGIKQSEPTPAVEFSPVPTPTGNFSPSPIAEVETAVETPPIDNNVQADSQTQSESLPPVFQNGVLMTAEENPSASSSQKTTVNKDKKDNQKTSLPLILVIFFVILLAIGVGSFIFWQKQNQEIAKLFNQNQEKEGQITALKNELVQAQDMMLMRQELPVYVDDQGKFSFLQEIPGLKTSKTTEAVLITYGEVNETSPVNGLVMTIENKSVEGLSLAKIAKDIFDSKENNTQNFDFRSELLGDTLGYSFLSVENGVQKLIYFLQKNAQSDNYLKIVYEIKAPDQTSYDSFEKIVFQVLNSIKIY